MTQRPAHWLALAGPPLLAGILLAPTLASVRFQQKADEGYYLYYAARTAQEGAAALPRLFREYVEGAQARQYFPTPLRLTTIAVDAAAVKCWGPTFRSLQRVSLIAFLGLLVMVGFTLQRLFGVQIALCTTLLLAASPLHLAMARRALSDSLVAAFVMTSFCAVILAVRQPRWRLKTWLGVAALHAITFLSREGAVTLMALSLAVLALERGRRPRVSFVLPLCAVSLIPLGAALAAASLAVGSPAAIGETVRIISASVPTNTYAVLYGSGPWFRYVIDLLLLSPWTVLLYVAWLGMLLGQRECYPQDWVWALAPLIMLLLLEGMTKNVRYVLSMELPIRLGAVLCCHRVITPRAGGWKAHALLGAVVAGIMVTDVSAFVRIFIIGELYDPISAPLLQVWGIIPR